VRELEFCAYVLKNFVRGKFCGEELKKIYQVTNSGILPFGILEQNIKNNREELIKKNFPWYLRG